MASTAHPIERGMALLRALILENSALAEEFAGSRGAFFGGQDPRGRLEGSALRMAEHRHLEWFALERPSRAQGELPLEGLAELWRQRADAEERGFYDALHQSVTGVFEVRDVEAGRGFWLSDLLGLGVYPVDEAEASRMLADGDVLAGRLFPLGDGAFRLSPAVGVFRNPELLAALQRDLGALRENRGRTTLRIDQVEIERMFFRAPSQASAHAAGGDPAEGETAGVETNGGAGDAGADLDHRAPDAEAPARLAEWLERGGMDPGEVRAFLAEVQAVLAAGGDPGAVVGEYLDRVAFDTELDLERTRELVVETLAALRDALRPKQVQAREAPAAQPRSEVQRAHRGKQRDAGKGDAGEGGTGERGVGRSQVAGALEAFDRGRAQGRDLDVLFRQLEEELELDPEAEEDPGLAPDFPGVLGAIVQEFLWEVGLVEGERQALAHRGLMGLATYGEAIGVFENFGPEHLLEFLARWSIERGDLSGARQAQSLLESVEKFCRWIEEQHHSPLWTLFARTHAELERSLPRIAELNDELGPKARRSAQGRRPTPIEVGAPARPSGELGLWDEAGDYQPLVAPAAVLAALERGDLVYWEPTREGAQVLLALPPEAARLTGEADPQ